MDSLDYWRLCDDLSVEDAAILIAGGNPSEGLQPDGAIPARIALVNAIIANRLPAVIRRSAWHRGWNEDPAEGEKMSYGAELHADNGEADFADDDWRRQRAFARRDGALIYRIEPDWKLTTVKVEDLRAWLAERGFRHGFFFPEASAAPDYFDRSHPRYAPKLAAAVSAWLAIDEAAGRTPKQALLKWLREHCADFELSKDDGTPNEQGIEECAKVANWQGDGGAPTTPGGAAKPARRK